MKLRNPFTTWIWQCLTCEDDDTLGYGIYLASSPPIGYKFYVCQQAFRHEILFHAPLTWRLSGRLPTSEYATKLSIMWANSATELSKMGRRPI